MIVLCLLAACGRSPPDQATQVSPGNANPIEIFRSGTYCFQFNKNFASIELEDGSIRFNYNSYSDFLNTKGPTGYGRRIGNIYHHSNDIQYASAVKFLSHDGRVTKIDGTIYSISNHSSISFTDAINTSVWLGNPDASTYSKQLNELVTITKHVITHASKCRSAP